MSFSKWQTDSDTRIANVVVSLPAGAAVCRAAMFWLNVGPVVTVGGALCRHRGRRPMRQVRFWCAGSKNLPQSLRNGNIGRYRHAGRS